MAERPVTAQLIIEEMCRELHMTEEQLLVHLAVEHSGRWLTPRGRFRVLDKARRYHQRNIFVLRAK